MRDRLTSPAERDQLLRANNQEPSWPSD